MYNNEALKQINQMSEVDKLKIFLGGYTSCLNWVGCDIRCWGSPISDEEILPILELKEKHNLSFRDFMTLYLSYWYGQFKRYRMQRGVLIPELEKEFIKLSPNRHFCKEYFWNDHIGEAEFRKLILSDNVNVYEFMAKYNLTELDFMVLAKSAVHGFVFSKTIGCSDKFVPDLDEVLITSLGDEKVKTLKRIAKSKQKNLRANK